MYFAREPPLVTRAHTYSSPTRSVASVEFGWHVQICALNGFAIKCASTGEVMTATTSEPCTTIYNMSLFMSTTQFSCYPCDVLGHDGRCSWAACGHGWVRGTAVSGTHNQIMVSWTWNNGVRVPSLLAAFFTLSGM